MPDSMLTAMPDTITVRLNEPSANLGLTTLSVTPGVVDAHARELFLYAKCQILALCLHERTGWPLWAAEQRLASGQWTWTHVAVRTPAGRWLDIEGPREPQAVTDWLDGWGLPVRLRLLDAAGWRAMLGLPSSTPAAWWHDQATTPAGVALAESFADVLLAQARKPLEAVRHG